MNARNQGASAERELARAIFDELGVRLVRNLEQSRRGGYDLVPDAEATGPLADWLGRCAIEVKRHAKARPPRCAAGGLRPSAGPKRLGWSPYWPTGSTGPTGRWPYP